MKKHKILNLIKQAFIIAENSKDEETKVAGILVDPLTMSQVSTGYNGFIRNCKYDNKLPKTRPAKYEFTLHCELNLIANAARQGISTQGKVLIQTLSPCLPCARMLYQSGITEVYFQDLYHIYSDNSLNNTHFPLIETTVYNLPDMKIILEKFENYYKMVISN